MALRKNETFYYQNDNNEYNYLDSAILNLESIAGLANVTGNFNGRIALVETNGVSVTFKLVGGVTKICWRITSITNFKTHNDLNNFCNEIITNLSSSLKVSKAFEIGDEITIVADEENDGKLTKYYVEKIEKVNKVWTITWAKVVSGEGGSVETVNDIEDAIEKSKTNGPQLIYLSEENYSYINPETSEIVYTNDKETIPEGVDYETYIDGGYMIINEGKIEKIPSNNALWISGNDIN